MSYCKKWKKQKSVNPLTGKSISREGVVFKRFKEFCKHSKTHCEKLKKSPKTNPVTDKKLSDTSKLAEFYAKLCELDKKEVVKNAHEATVKVSENNVLEQNPLACTEYTNVTLREHQSAVCNYIKKHPKQKGMILFHSVGSGKTITAITIIRCTLAMHPDKNVFVVTPTSLIDNFKKEMAKLGVDFGDKVKLYSHTRFANRINEAGPEFCRDSVIIVDEAHNFKAVIKKNSGHRAKMLMLATHIASSVYLMTATPIQNAPIEFANLYAMVTRNENNIDQVYRDFIELKPKIFDNLKNRISYFKNSDTTEYPSVEFKNVEFYMTRLYYKLYKEVELDNIDKLQQTVFKNSGKLTSFYNGIRRAVNNIDEQLPTPKIEWVLNKLSENNKKGKKTMVYSNWLKAGQTLIQNKLIEKNIKYVEVNGHISAAKRKTAVDSFNKDKVNILFISSAGAEGLDLKGTREIIILEPYWNNERLQQVIGRGARYRSHAHLPKSEQNVTIYNLYLKKPKNVSDEMPSADILLRDFSSQKETAIRSFYHYLIQCAIKNSKHDGTINVQTPYVPFAFGCRVPKSFI